MLEGSGEEIEITSTADSSTTLQHNSHNSAKAETISTIDVDEPGVRSKVYDDRTYSLIYPDNQEEQPVLQNSEGSQGVPQTLHHNGDDEMLRRYLQDTVQYNDSREIDSSQEVYEHFLFSNATESSYKSENEGTENYENMDETGCEEYVGHEVGVPKSLTRGIDLDEDFGSSDSFASTESIIPKRIQCPKCPKKFMFKADLKRHDKHKHLRIIDSYFCRFCKKAFDTKEFLKSHEQVHVKRKLTNRYRCLYCKKTYKNPGNLSYHLKRCPAIESSK